MPQFETNSNLLDYLMSIYDRKEARFYLVMKSISFSFGISPIDINQLTGLLHHGDDVCQVTFKALLYLKDKTYLKETYHIQIDSIGKLFFKFYFNQFCLLMYN